MGAKIRIEHKPEGWADVYKSDGIRAAVDEAGQRIAAEAGEHFVYVPSDWGSYAALGFVDSIDEEGDELEATDKVLTKAVHA